MKAAPADCSICAYNSVGGSAFFDRLLGEWRERGLRVQSVHAVTEGDYRRATGRGARLLLRWRMYGGFAARCFRTARKTPGAIHIVTTNPFFAPTLVARAARRRARVITLVYDLYPDALIQAGAIAPDSWWVRRAEALTRAMLRESAVTVYLGRHLLDHAERRYGPSRRSVIIPVGADGRPFRERSPQFTAEPPEILYSGQMGLMHDTDTVATVLASNDSGRVRWVFKASGPGYAVLRRRLGDRPSIVWGSSLPDTEWRRQMLRSQVALVTIAPGAEDVVMPSKTYSALVAGQAILAICPSSSDLAELVRTHDCGWVVEPGAVAALERVVDEIAHSPARLFEKRRNAFAAGHHHYDVARLADEWMSLFAAVAASPIDEVPSGASLADAARTVRKVHSA